MKQQFNLLIIYCLTLTFFGCDSLRPADVVRKQQQERSFRNCENFCGTWQSQRLQDSLPSPREWETIFLPLNKTPLLPVAVENLFGIAEATITTTLRQPDKISAPIHISTGSAEFSEGNITIQ